jgi:hypothetical protein
MHKNKQVFFSDHEVRVRAYLIWEREGRPEGNSESYWHRAIGELETEARAKNGGPAVEPVPPHPGVSEPQRGRDDP